MNTKNWLVPLTLALVLAVLTVPATVLGQQSFNGNALVMDSQGKLLSWIQPQSAAYGRVVELAWGGLKRVPVQSNGLKTYLGWATFDPNDFSGTGGPHNPAGLYAMFADSALRSYPYLGDASVLGIAQQTLDYQLAHGLTADGWAWGHVPYASADVGATTYQGSDDSGCGGCGSGDGVGVIEPDKVGEEGYAYLRMWEQTGNAAYRDAAITFANVLAAHVRTGDGTHSPWPFRVNARTNQVREDYTAHVLGPVMLFDELIRLNLGNVGQYQAARQTAWTWLMTFPMRNKGWSQYFEDVPIQSDPLHNVNQYIPLRTASYIIQHPEFDPNWRSDVPAILSWVEQKFADPQHGAQAVSEQEWDMDKMGSHTSRYASVAAEWSEASGDASWKEKAFRSFNWASYMAHSNGVVSVGVDGSSGWWFSDGYGDYIRHFVAGMGAVPEWAPTGENHLLRSTSVVQTISYGSGAVRYRTFDADGTEVLRLNFSPGAITSGGQPLGQRADLAAAGYTLQPIGSDFVVRVRHASAGDVAIIASSVAPYPSTSPTASATTPPTASPTTPPTPTPTRALGGGGGGGQVAPPAPAAPRATTPPTPTPTPTSPPPATAPPLPPVSPSAAPAVAHDSRYFPATGYRIDDDALSGYFSARGQIDTFGYPVSRTFMFLGCPVQVFQRLVAQACAGHPALLNLLDPDLFAYTQLNGSGLPAPDDELKNTTPRIGDPNYATAIVDFVRANAPDSFEGQRVNFGGTFFGLIGSEMAGTDNPNLLELLNLEVWGAPISHPVRDSNNADFVYQRFQRAIMHFDASTGVTRGILLADYMKAVIIGRDLPADLREQAQGSRFYQQYCPGAARWLCRADELPATDMTFAFEPG